MESKPQTRGIMQRKRASAVLETGAACGASRSVTTELANEIFATGHMVLNKGKVANKRLVLRIFN
jgi:hypothetical protein